MATTTLGGTLLTVAMHRVLMARVLLHVMGDCYISCLLNAMQSLDRMLVTCLSFILFNIRCMFGLEEIFHYAEL